jgi:hypothetical protein
MISAIPYRHLVIDTYLSSDKAASILSAALGSLYSKPSVFRWFQGNPRGFKGEVSSDEFTIRRVYPPWLYDSLLAVLYGRFNPRRSGTQIDVKITLSPITLVVLAMMFLVGVYQIALYTTAWISAKSFDSGLVYTIVIMLFWYGLTILSFNYQADAVTDFIQRVYKRHSRE